MFLWENSVNQTDDTHAYVAFPVDDPRQTSWFEGSLVSAKTD